MLEDENCVGGGVRAPYGRRSVVALVLGVEAFAQ